jgi:cyclic pyranopterin phosphate synthase
MSEKKLSHIDETGRANMVDVGHKPMQIRVAKAEGRIFINAETMDLIKKNMIKKGDVLPVAEVAGIQGAKNTSSLIPLCHPLLLSKVDVKASLERDCVLVESTVKTTGQTGVEMEALTGVSVALLTIYDMCKAVDKEMKIGEITLIEKTKVDIDEK